MGFVKEQVYFLVLRIVFIIGVGVVLSSCGQSRHPVKGDTTRSQECGLDCLGALTSDQCVLLDSSRWQDGIAGCTEQCEIDLSACVPKSTVDPSLACTVQGLTRCANDTVVEICSDEQWRALENCAITNKVCGVAPSVGFSCVVDDGTVTPVSCDFESLTAAQTTAEFDTDLNAYNRLIAYNSDRSAWLEIELKPGVGGVPALGATVPFTLDLSGVNSKYDSCGACVRGYQTSGQGGSGFVPTFMPSQGSLKITAYPTTTGDILRVELVDVSMREVRISPTSGTTTDVGNGRHWCFSASQLSATSTRFLCDTAGEGYCNSGSALVHCSNGFWTPDDCSIGNTVCRMDAQNGAACASPMTACNKNDFTPTPGETLSFYDNDVFQTHRIEAKNNIFKQALVFDNHHTLGGLTQAGAVSLTGENSDYNACPTCLGIYPFPGQSSIAYYFARWGTLDVTQMATVMGGGTTVNIQQVELHRIDPSTGKDIRGGGIWCLNNVTVGINSSTRFQCDWPNKLLGAPLFTSGQSICVGDVKLNCSTVNGVELGADCAASGQVCSAVAPTAAICQ